MSCQVSTLPFLLREHWEKHKAAWMFTDWRGALVSQELEVSLCPRAMDFNLKNPRYTHASGERSAKSTPRLCTEPPSESVSEKHSSCIVLNLLCSHRLHENQQDKKRVPGHSLRTSALSVRFKPQTLLTSHCLHTQPLFRCIYTLSALSACQLAISSWRLPKI